MTLFLVLAMLLPSSLWGRASTAVTREGLIELPASRRRMERGPAARRAQDEPQGRRRRRATSALSLGLSRRPRRLAQRSHPDLAATRRRRLDEQGNGLTITLWIVARSRQSSRWARSPA